MEIDVFRELLLYTHTCIVVTIQRAFVPTGKLNFRSFDNLLFCLYSQNHFISFGFIVITIHRRYIEIYNRICNRDDRIWANEFSIRPVIEGAFFKSNPKRCIWCDSLWPIKINKWYSTCLFLTDIVEPIATYPKSRYGVMELYSQEASKIFG